MLPHEYVDLAWNLSVSELVLRGVNLGVKRVEFKEVWLRRGSMRLDGFGYRQVFSWAVKE